jgi:excinuclease ABC, C subunit
MAFVIEDELKKLPHSPGVYIMHDKNDEIIYVGKAISLRNRVRQYFQSSKDKSAKIQQMISKIDRFEYIVTDSELEALVLENNLIKENRPRYNTMLKDDKTYPYIKITIKEDFPRIFMTREIKKDKAKYFGPFSSSLAVKDTLDLIYKIFKIRTCNRVLPRDIGLQRPCLDYYIHQCDAPCYGYISKEDYQKNVEGAIRFLNGKHDEIIENLREKMNAASLNYEYEEALKYRDLINSILHITQKQKITSESMQDRDIVALAKSENDAVIQIFFIREGKIVGREHHYVHISVDDDNSQILESFIKQFYAGTPFLPKEIWLQQEIEDTKIITDWLTEKRGDKVKIVVPKKGDKEKLVELAIKNAKLVLDKDISKLKKEETKSIGAVKELEELIGLKNIVRMEAFDISNISGVESVGSMVVYELGKPKKSDYRKFRIKTVIGPNDYASMEEVLTRRFTHDINNPEKSSSFSKLPDLILMDGGKGQVNIALEVLNKLNLNIPVCGMVKDDNHRTRGLFFNNVELPINTHSESFHLITRIQDEAHRFAIEYHRSLRSKGQVKSILDDIQGVGPKRRRALVKHFKSLDNIKTATIEDIKTVESMDLRSATSVYEFFHKDENVK